jgi:hypothetical protein
VQLLFCCPGECGEVFLKDEEFGSMNGKGRETHQNRSSVDKKVTRKINRIIYVNNSRLARDRNRSVKSSKRRDVSVFKSCMQIT